MLQSLNGKITSGDKDDLMWGGKADKKSFAQLTKGMGTMIVGSTTFEAWGKRALPERKTIVLTRSPERYAEYASDQLTFTSETPEELTARLEKEGHKEVALVGGGKINYLFFKAKLVDDLYVTIAPWVFTSGIDIIDETNDLGSIYTQLKLLETTKLDEETILLHYETIYT